MKNLFLRFYLMLTVTFVLLGWSIDTLYEQYVEDEAVISDLDMHKGTLSLLNRELARIPEMEKESYVLALAPSFGYPISFFSKKQLLEELKQYQQTLTTEQLNYLAQGGQIALIDDDTGLSWYFQVHQSTQRVISLGPIRIAGANDNTIMSVFFLLVMAVTVFAWVWPLSKGLVTLNRAAQQFGEGDFSARAPYKIARPFIPLVERFNDMAERIQRLIRSHKELSHAVSHELRTPIARIRFAMEMTRELPDPEKREYYFNTMNENIEELDGLVDELLTYARFDREKPKLKFVKQNLYTLAEDVVEGYRMTEHQLNFDIVCHRTKPILAVFDYDALSRVLDNLLRNAVRYAERKITIELNIDPEHRAVIKVTDDGAGIPEENWDKLFDPFVRLDQSRDRNSGGIGLGLAIVRRYMEWHKGTVKVNNVTPHGAQFTLSWPTSKEFLD